MGGEMGEAVLAGQNFAPGVGGKDVSDKLGAAGRGNRAASVFSFGFLDGVDQIAFADGRPIQPVGFVQNHFPRFSRTASHLRRTHDNFHLWFIRHPVGIRHNHRRMRFSPARWLPTVNLKSLHSSKGDTFLLLCATMRLSVSCQAASWGSFLTSGRSITISGLTGRARLTIQVSASICWTVTGDRAGSSGGMTKRRRSSVMVAYIMGASHGFGCPSNGKARWRACFDKTDREVESFGRSEERRVGKECRSRWSPYH